MKKKNKTTTKKRETETYRAGEKTGSGWKTFGLVFLFVLGMSILSYPFVSNWLAQRNVIHTVDNYNKYVVNLSDEQLEEEWTKAEQYNENLKGDPLHDPFVPGSGYALPTNYKEVLNVNGMMGYLEIPCIEVELPIYHGTSDEVLKKGVGHVEQTALPIGGDGTHAVLTSHTGLPRAKLFTDLVKMEKGDKFYIYVLDKKLTYQVDKIDVILPEDIDQLRAEAGTDYVTLVTCTPYGINSHRLLVRGTRIPNEKEPKQKSRVKHIPRWVWLLIALVILMIIILVERKRRKRRRCRKDGKK